MNIDFRGPNQAIAYRLLSNLVMPRPIAWVTSLDTKGNLNLAPFSFFNLMGSEPPIVVLGIGKDQDGRPKHTGRNIAATREFVVNLVTEDLMHPMNITAADFPEGHNELRAAGLTEAPSTVIRVPRVAQAQAALECTLHSIPRIGDNDLVIGEVVALYVADGLVDDRFRVRNFAPIGRMGSPSAYTRTTDQFDLPRISYEQFRQSAHAQANHNPTAPQPAPASELPPT